MERITTSLLVLISLCFTLTFIPGDYATRIGVNYGVIADDLPLPSAVAQFIVQCTTIDRVKLFDSNPEILRAFSGTPISITVSVPNNVIVDLTNISSAQKWLRTNILPFSIGTNIVRISVGNEVVTTDNKTLIDSLIPAMQNLHTALVGSGLDHRIKVSTPHSLTILDASYPPSTGIFKSSYTDTVFRPLLNFLRSTGSPFMINPYPYFGFTADTIDFALFRPNSGVLDEYTGLIYANMLDGQIDAVFSAMKKLGFDDVEIVIAETGWPSSGGALGADVESAAAYNGNLIRHANSGVGTPLMPNRTFETYVFALFNENMKPGPEYERHFGLFRPDMTPVYDIGIMKKTDPRNPVTRPSNRIPVTGKRWCLPKINSNLASLQANIDYVCGLGLDCSPIQNGGSCFFPDTIRAHAAYAMNLYYQVAGKSNFDCNFGQTGEITSVDPSYGHCRYDS